MAKISVFGLGYVGTVCSACLASRGFAVTGVDVNNDKVRIINNGHAPIIEADIGPLVEEVVRGGMLKATDDGREAVADSDISMVCVGTPSNGNGSLSTEYVENVCRQIGESLRDKGSYHIVVIRSTVLPGTVNGVVIPALEEASGKTAGRDFGVAMNPEFLREGTSVSDFYNPPKTVIGSLNRSDADAIAALYEGLPGPVIKTSIEVAEMVKYVDNAFHALKVTFANEIGDICKALGIDSHEVMNIFCQDTKLNISSYYLKPGFAFGGSCLPKDVRALTYKATRLDVSSPLLNAIIPSNMNHIEVGLKRIMSFEKKRIGFLGFGFKAGTDDLRESPIVELIERLLGKGYDIRIYDRNVSLAKLFGANKRFIEQKIPHISKLMVGSVEEILGHAEVVVIGNNAPEFRRIFQQNLNGQIIVDLVRASDNVTENSNYEGICW